MQAQIEDGARLRLGQRIAAVDDLAARLVDQLDQGRDVAGRPGLGHQRLARRDRVLGGADRRDHRIEVGDRERQADQDMGAVARLAELVDRAPGDDLLAEGDEASNGVAHRHLLGPAAVERQHVDREGRLQRREMEQLIQDDFGDRIALEFDDDAQAVAVRFVAQFRDALDAFVAHRLRNALDHARLVDLEGDLGRDDRLAVLADLLEMGPRAHRDRAAPGVLGGADAGATQDQAAGREVRAGHQLGDLVDRDGGIVDVCAAGVDHLAQVMRRDVGRHADGDAAGAVDQQVWEARRQHNRLFHALVVVGLEIDGVLVDILDQRVRRLRHAHLGVAHRRRRIAVHRAEVALAVGQHQPHREVLRHAHHGVVDRRVAVRMVLGHDLADDARRLAVRLVGGIAGALHAEDDAPVNRLQAVAHIGQRARHDDAHRVVEVGAFHLLFDRDRLDVELRRAYGICHL